MDKINAIIVDDELGARENLQHLLFKFCKEVNVVAEADSVNEALLVIEKHKPQIVFLDIEMPKKNGFHLLDELPKINFQIIFTTAYDSYAVRAFKVSAVDYLLKPISIGLLQKAVAKAKKIIETADMLEHRISVLKENKNEITKIAIPYKSDYVIVNINDVLCIEADRMYCIIHTSNNKKYVIAKKLSYYEDLLCKKDVFIRIHRSWIVNVNRINSYSKKERQVTLMADLKIPVSKTKKEYFEKRFYA